MPSAGIIYLQKDHKLQVKILSVKAIIKNRSAIGTCS